MNFRKVKAGINQYLFFIIFISIIFLTIIFSLIKIFSAKTQDLYIKVKLGQGLWWATTNKPPVWLVQGITKGQKEYNLLNKSIAQVLGIRYYPLERGNINNYDVFLTVKLRVNKNKKTNQFSYKRSPIGVGAPIDFEFPTYQIAGTVIDLSERPFSNSFEEKTIYLTKRLAYPWEFEAIQVGDSYFDGEETVFNIVDKKSTDTVYNLDTDVYGNINTNSDELRRYIVLKAKIKLQKKADAYVFGEEEIVKIGNSLNLSTPKLSLGDYVVAAIE